MPMTEEHRITLVAVRMFADTSEQWATDDPRDGYATSEDRWDVLLGCDAAIAVNVLGMFESPEQFANLVRDGVEAGHDEVSIVETVLEASEVHKARAEAEAGCEIVYAAERECKTAVFLDAAPEDDGWSEHAATVRQIKRDKEQIVARFRESPPDQPGRRP